MPTDATPVVWLNGQFVSADRAAISPFDRGLLYGDGVFETLRAERGAALYLREHLQRLRNSLAELRICAAIDLGWSALLRELLQRNGLDAGVAAAKILVTRGVAAGLGLPAAGRPTVCLSARPYHEPDYAAGWRLHVMRDGFSPPLARHKTLNYLFFLAARQAAADAGADEALVLDPWGHVAETAAASLLVRLDGEWSRPGTRYQLAGVTVDAATKLLAGSGQCVEPRPLTEDDLAHAQTVWALNSLMGVMPVLEVDGRRVPEPMTDDAALLRARLFEQGDTKETDA